MLVNEVVTTELKLKPADKYNRREKSELPGTPFCRCLVEVELEEIFLVKIYIRPLWAGKLSFTIVTKFSEIDVEFPNKMFFAVIKR